MRSGLITHPEKVLFPERGETKGDLAEHYLRVAEPLMRAIMGGRPVSCRSASPRARPGRRSSRKRVPKNIPDWLQTTTVSTPNGTTSQALVAADPDHVLWAVNLGCLGFHVWRPPWPPTPATPTSLRIDLDPTPGRGLHHDPPGRPGAAAGLLDEALASSATPRRPVTGACTYTSGWSRAGTPIRSGRRRGRRARARAPQARPDHRRVVEGRTRGARVFVDFNQNAPHKTVFGAWSVRARPGAQVSTPLSPGQRSTTSTRTSSRSPHCPPGSTRSAIRGSASTTPRSHSSRCWR